jgi:hypothetical protein
MQQHTVAFWDTTPLSIARVLVLLQESDNESTVIKNSIARSGAKKFDCDNFSNNTSNVLHCKGLFTCLTVYDDVASLQVNHFLKESDFQDCLGRMSSIALGTNGYPFGDL